MAGCLLHEQVFRGDLQTVKKLLETEDPAQKDAHGNFNIVMIIGAVGRRLPLGDIFRENSRKVITPTRYLP